MKLPKIIEEHYAAFCLLIICASGALAVATYSGCAKEADAQEVERVEVVKEKVADMVMPPVVGEAEQVETFDVEVTRWEPKTYIEKRTRRRALPVFQTERRATDLRGNQWIEDAAPVAVIESETVTEFIEDAPKIMSVPRVIKETKNRRGETLRRVQRNDNFISVDGYNGTGYPALMQADKPTDGFGGVQVGLLNRNNQPFSNAVIDRDENVRFNGPNAQRLNSVQADVDGDFGSEEQEEESSGLLKGLIGRNKNKKLKLFRR
jgi:hypothetical protein